MHVWEGGDHINNVDHVGSSVQVPSKMVLYAWVQNTCSDTLKNGDETDTDCGGSCPSCDAGKKCASATDCASNICNGGLCMVRKQSGQLSKLHIDKNNK
jgi:hypothetical protein